MKIRLVRAKGSKLGSLLLNPGVRCIKSYVSKRGYEFGGWYVYLDFHGVISQQNVPTPEIRTHVSYVS